MKRFLLLIPLMLASGCPNSNPNQPGQPEKPWFEPVLPKPYTPPDDEYDPSPSYPCEAGEKPRRFRFRERLNEDSRGQQQ